MMNRLTNYRSEQKEVSLNEYSGESSVHKHQFMDNWKVPTTKVKLLPATPLGLVKRF